MKKSPVLTVLFLGLLVVGLLGGGCATSSSSSYYYYPNWTPDGKIICVKKTVTSTSGGSFVFPGDEETHYYLTTMSDEGTQEAEVKEINRIGKVIASPLGNYIAYSDGNYIRIVTSSGATVKSIDCSESINSFDWSPNETRLTFSGNDSKDLYMLCISSEVKTQIASSAEGVSWRVGNNIVYEDSEINRIWISNIDGSSKEVVVPPVSARPQILGTKIIFRENGAQIKSINIDGTEETLLFSGYQRSTLNLSFNGAKIVGGDLDNYGNIKGVWVSNIDGTGQKQLQ